MRVKEQAASALSLLAAANGETQIAIAKEGGIAPLIALLDIDMGSEEIMMRMTGCPNGCARPYMAELAFVGEGMKTYQMWVGGSVAR